MFEGFPDLLVHPLLTLFSTILDEIVVIKQLVSAYLLRIRGAITHNGHLVIKRYDSELPVLSTVCHVLDLLLNGSL